MPKRPEKQDPPIYEELATAVGEKAPETPEKEREFGDIEEKRVWEYRVKSSIEEAEKNIERLGYGLEDCGVGREKYIQEKLEYFRQEIARIKAEVAVAETVDVDEIAKDILDDFEQSEELETLENKRLMCVARTAPWVIFKNIPIWREREDIDLEELLKAASQTVALKEPEYVLAYADDIKGYEKWYKSVLKQAVITYSNQTYPGGLLSPNYIKRFRDEPWAEQYIKKAAEKDADSKMPFDVINYIYTYKDYEWAEEVFTKAGLKYVSQAIKCLHSYKDEEWAQGAVRKFAEKDPSDAYREIRIIRDHFGIEFASEVMDLIIEGEDRYPFMHYAREVSRKDCTYYCEEKDGDREKNKELLEMIVGKIGWKEASTNPRGFLLNLGKYDRLPITKEMVIRAAEQDPWTVALLYRTSQYSGLATGKIPERFLKIDSKIFKIVEEVEELPNWRTRGDVFYLVDPIMKGELTVQEAFRIVEGNPARLWRMVNEIAEQEEYYGKVSIENFIKEFPLRVVWRINRLHNSSDAVRFEILKDFDAGMIYDFIVLGTDEVYTSTFLGMYKRMKQKMKKEGLNGYKLLEKKNFKKFRLFLKTCSNYGKLEDFLNSMESEEKEKIIDKFMLGLLSEKEDKLPEAVTVAETIFLIKDEKILKEIGNKIKKGYNEAKDTKTKSLYGLLASLYGSIEKDDKWFGEMSEKYKLDARQYMESKELFNEKGDNIQQYFFHDDRPQHEDKPKLWDGHHSFKSFMRQYGVEVNWGKKGEIFHIGTTRHGGWETRDRGSYVVITSDTNREGKKIVIYANKPTHDPQEIRQELHEKERFPSVIVHRGHSYHLYKTQKWIGPDTALIGLGSCGGYRNISDILNTASKTHVIATKGTGTMSVNDPLFKMLNEEILSKNKVEWKEFWGKAGKRLGKHKDFPNYISPHKNIGVKFIRAYNEINRTNETYLNPNY